MNRIKFVTLHPAGVNVDLTKDEGQIPYTLCSNYNIDSTIVTCHIDKKTANLKCVSGLKVKHFPLIFNYALTGVIYILINAKKIDWLNIYFAGRQAYYWSKLYKFINRKGHVYLKLDMDFRGSNLYEENEKEREIFRKNTEIVDIVSVESKEIKKRIQRYSTKEILLIENGISKPDFNPNFEVVRENVILTVGRLGTKQKATDILLEAFAKSSDKHEWKLKLIGNIQQEFVTYINEYFKKYPNLKDRVIFTGEIKNREDLYSEYCHAKVFTLPSRWESFGISCGEALTCGCYLILSDSIPPAKEMTCDGKYGTIVESENAEALCEAFVNITNKLYTQNEINEITYYGNKLFSWDIICDKLYNAMQEVIK